MKKNVKKNAAGMQQFGCYLLGKGIEGFFCNLKNHLDLHRLLTTKNRINFIKWYIYFSNEK